MYTQYDLGEPQELNLTKFYGMFTFWREKITSI